MPALPEGGVDGEQLNLDDPLLADTLPIVSRYYRYPFVADNPGWRTCTATCSSMEEGLQLALNVAEDRQPEPPQAL